MDTEKQATAADDADRAEELDRGYAIYRELVQVINEAPKPRLAWNEELSLEERCSAVAPGIAWGWLQRTIRNGEAAIELERIGYGVEAGPLLRSALEHAMRLIWAGSGEGPFVEVAMLTKKETSRKILQALPEGRPFDEVLVEQLKQFSEFITDEFSGLGIHGHLKGAIDKSSMETKERLKSMYLLWLAYTPTCHPSIDSAEPYIEKRPESHDIVLLSAARPKENKDCAEVSVFALIGAVYGYSLVTMLNDYFDPVLQNILDIYADYFEH